MDSVYLAAYVTDYFNKSETNANTNSPNYTDPKIPQVAPKVKGSVTSFLV